LAVARHLGATVTRFDRRAEDHFAVDPEAIARTLTPRTRLIVLTNLHNPSGALTDDATLARVGELASEAGARVLVDEVYLDAAFARAPTSAAHLGPSFVAVSSLTKVYGLAGLRCGWALAEPELARRLWRLGDLYDNHGVHPGQRLSAVALANLPHLRARARALLDANRPLVDELIAGRAELDAPPTPHGTIVFPRLDGGEVDALCALLRDRYDTSVVPGRFFEMPDRFRIGIGCDTELLAEGLVRLAAALDQLRAPAR
jgi:aspartate/methionine/tyrosine aminotransferase